MIDCWECRAEAIAHCRYNPEAPEAPFDCYVPNCNADGTFARAQYDIITNTSFCVDPLTGECIEETRVSGSVIDCSGIEFDTPLPAVCLVKRARALEAGDAYVPVCAADGTFAPIQCYDGYCWCSNNFGQYLLNSFHVQNINTPICGVIGGNIVLLILINYRSSFALSSIIFLKFVINYIISFGNWNAG